MINVNNIINKLPKKERLKRKISFFSKIKIRAKELAKEEAERLGKKRDIEIVDPLDEKLSFGGLKDSGDRRKFDSGAVRDMASGKGRFDLLQFHGVARSALQLEKGANKYGIRNWEKGMNLSVFVDSALRHLVKYAAGFDDEDHLSAAIWNLNCLAEGEERIKQGIWPKELDDLPKTYKGKEPSF